MKKNIVYVAALAMLAAACSNEDNTFLSDEENNGTGEVRMITETITATNGDANGTTRAAVDDNAKFSWSAGDKIAVHVSDGTNGKYVTTSALTAGDISDDGADFTVSYEEGYSRDAFAVYPASIVASDAANYGQEDQSLDVTLPSSYTLAQVSGTTTPCPMIASNTGDTWTFKQLCGLLRLTVKGIPADATGMVIQFPGKKVNGNFSIASPVTPGESTISTGAPADGEDKITVTFAAGTTEAIVNIPLPDGDYEDVYVTPVGSETKVAALRFIKAGGYTATRARAKKLTTTMVSFSVSATKKVVFAPGNLVKTNSGCEVGSGYDTYAFETTPFNTNGGSLGYKNGAPTNTSARGYFTWSEILSNGETSDSPRMFTLGGISTWRVLTDSEFSYLLSTRGVGAAYQYYKVKIDGTSNYGVLLTPDNANSSDVSSLNGPNKVNTVSDIDSYISKGYVFLPAAGKYLTSSSSWTDAFMATYWTSTAYDEDNAYTRHGNISSSFMAWGRDNGTKSYYCPVRLVHNLN